MLSATPPSAATALLSYRPELDGVRAIGLLIVVSHHWMALATPIGEAALTVFFAQSGYLISSIVWQQRTLVDQGRISRGQALVVFYLRRGLRILPAYYLAVGVSALLPLATVREHWPWFVLHGANVLFYQLGRWGEGCGHFWTLAVEEQFYTMWPLLLLFVPWRRQGGLLLALLGIAFVFRLGWALAVTPNFMTLLMPANIDAFAAGALLRLAESQLPRAWRGYGRLALLGWALWLALWVAETQFGAELTWLIGGFSCSAVAAAATLGWVLHAPGRRQRAVLLHPVIQWIGLRSYSLYLYHLLLPVLYQRLLYRLIPDGPDAAAARALWLGPWPTLLLLTPALAVLGAISWRFVERPFNELKRVLPYQKRPAMMPPSAAGYARPAKAENRL